MSHVKVEPGVWSLLDGTRQMEARVSRQGDDYLVTVRGRQIRTALCHPDLEDIREHPDEVRPCLR